MRISSIVIILGACLGEGGVYGSGSGNSEQKSRPSSDTKNDLRTHNAKPQPLVVEEGKGRGRPPGDNDAVMLEGGSLEELIALFEEKNVSINKKMIETDLREAPPVLLAAACAKLRKSDWRFQSGDMQETFKNDMLLNPALMLYVNDWNGYMGGRDSSALQEALIRLAEEMIWPKAATDQKSQPLTELPNTVDLEVISSMLRDDRVLKTDWNVRQILKNSLLAVYDFKRKGADGTLLRVIARCVGMANRELYFWHIVHSSPRAANNKGYNWSDSINSFLLREGADIEYAEIAQNRRRFEKFLSSSKDGATSPSH